jgi:uncharacterized protein YndB with AHSA1/START domain
VIEPLRLSFQVECPADLAFDVWTQRIATWWPVSHSVSAEPDIQVVLEPRVGGRIFERTVSGAEHDWGEITVWEPPQRLVYVWHLRRDRVDATEVEISFHELDPSTTVVEIEQRGWERLGARGPDWRNANLAGWNGLLPHFMDAIQREYRKESV